MPRQALLRVASALCTAVALHCEGPTKVVPAVGRWPGGITGQLAFTSAGGSLYVAISADVPPRPVAEVPLWLRNSDALRVAWNPRSDTLAVSGLVQRGVGPGLLMWYVDPSGSQPPAPPFFPVWDYPTWAPDGRFASCQYLHLGDVWDEFVVLGGSPVLRGCSGPFDIFPDGRSLALSRILTRVEQVSGPATYTFGLYVVPLADTAAGRFLVVDTVQVPGCPSLENCPLPPRLDPVISPAGDQIAFVRSSMSGGIAIWVVSPDGTGLRRLTAGGGPPAWSPDGTWVVFLGLGGIAAIRPDGTDSLRLFTLPTIGAFGWSRQ